MNEGKINEGKDFLSRIIPGTRILQSQTGSGSVNEDHIEHAQNVLKDGKESYAHQFDDFFARHLSELEEYKARIDHHENDGDVMNLIASSVANFRANSSMIGNQEYLNICSMLLTWAESIKQINFTVVRDIKEILEGYILTIKTIECEKNISTMQIDDLTKEVDSCLLYTSDAADE